VEVVFGGNFPRWQLSYTRDLQTFLSEGHISYHTTVWGPDSLCKAIVSGYVTFYQINKCSWRCYFIIVDKMFLQSGWNGFAGRIWPMGLFGDPCPRLWQLS